MMYFKYESSLEDLKHFSYRRHEVIWKDSPKMEGRIEDYILKCCLYDTHVNGDLNYELVYSPKEK